MTFGNLNFKKAIFKEVAQWVAIFFPYLLPRSLSGLLQISPRILLFKLQKC